MNIALKYRPSNFKDLVGQDILVRILENAFTLNKIPQSILLSGSSGVGKTTTARIIALCLNCSLGPTFEPCGLCESCLAIKDSRHPDVIEIDAASHTSIDDIKVILGDICYSPISSKFKVYIIDEIHMLSNSAFNALLKTLEEPPSNVKFILATTEIKKIPITIVARCQRFDLYNISATKIAKRLSDVAQKENYSIEKEALELIAHHSGNSMRNALFLMNQAVLYSRPLAEPVCDEKFLGEVKVSTTEYSDVFEERRQALTTKLPSEIELCKRSSKDGVISTSDVMSILGLVDRDIIFDLLQAVLDGDLQKALMVFDKGVSTTNSLNIFEDLLQIIQLVCRFLITKEIDSTVTEYETNRVKELGVKKSLIFFSRLWRILLKGIQDIKASTCNDIAAEMMLISLCYLSDLPSPEQVVKKVLAQNVQKGDQPCATHSVIRADDYSDPKKYVENKQQNYDFDKILQLLRQDNQIYLYKQLCSSLELVNCKPGYLKLKAISRLDNSFCDDLKGYLSQVTQQEWVVVVDTYYMNSNYVNNLSDAPTVRDILDTFKGAKVMNIENKE